jgi:uncharacterized membrane protein YdbT with pleckstrin-like domain
MSYVQNVLQPGEQIRHIARIHWITYLPGFLVLIVAAALAIWIFAAGGNSVWYAAPAVTAVAGLILCFNAWFHRWTTEIAVTNRRVIYKTGFIRRDTNKMHMDKVESVRVDQSIPGRILDYGDVTVLGTGEGFETIRTIAAPLALRNQIAGT